MSISILRVLVTDGCLLPVKHARRDSKIANVCQRVTNCNNLHLDLLIGMFKLIERLFYHLLETVVHVDSRQRQGGDEEWDCL